MAGLLANIPGRDRALPLVKCFERHGSAMARGLMIAGALVSSVALAFYGALRWHAAPPPTDWRAAYKKWINGKGCGEQ
jgi:hypothetical protein